MHGQKKKYFYLLALLLQQPSHSIILKPYLPPPQARVAPDPHQVRGTVHPHHAVGVTVQQWAESVLVHLASFSKHALEPQSFCMPGCRCHILQLIIIMA